MPLYNIDGRRVFDPDSPEFADVPLIEVADDGWRVVRGRVPDEVSVVLEQVRSRGIVGVVANNLGHVVYVRSGEEFEDPRRVTMLLSIHSMLGHAASLDEVSQALAKTLSMVEAARARGWELHFAVDDAIWVTPAER